METSCSNCSIDYSRLNIKCAYCVVNPEKRSSNFIPIKPKIDEIDFGGIEIHNLDSLMAEGWSWSVEECIDHSCYNLIVYLNNITLTELTSYEGCYEKVKQEVIKKYNLPLGRC